MYRLLLFLKWNSTYPGFVQNTEKPYGGHHSGNQRRYRVMLKRSATKYRTLKIYLSFVSRMNIIYLVNLIEYLDNCIILGLNLLVISVIMGTKTLMASFCI